MNKLLLTLMLLILWTVAFAQVPQGIPYQAVARNSAGAILATQPISLRFTIHDSVASGAIAYRETFAVTTNNLGLFNVNVGTGTVVSGTFSGIDWGTNAKFMQVEMDPAGGTSYVDMGTQQMMSVPYALYAGSAGSASVYGSSPGDEFVSGNFGDASDGDVNVNTGTFTSGPISGNALTRDAYFNNLTLSGGSLVTNGYRLLVKGTLKRLGTYKMFWNGNAGGAGGGGFDANTSIAYSIGGSGGVGGSGLSAGTLTGSAAGGSGGVGGGAGANISAGGGIGGTGSSSASTTKASCIGNPAVAGGSGGSGLSAMSPVSVSGGSGGYAPLGSTTMAVMRPRIVSILSLMADFNGGSVLPYNNSTAGTGGGGGGGGGGFSTSYSPWYCGGTGGGGGGAGSNSGTFFISAYNIVDSGSGNMFEFRGGNGGAGGIGGSCGNNNSSPNGGAAGGGGGGAGGNGGSGVLIYVNKAGACSFDLSGGTGGAGGSGGAGSTGGSYPHSAGIGGAAGNNGAQGILYEFDL